MRLVTDIAERSAYVRGALEACAALKVSKDSVTAVCVDLRITPEELMRFAAEERSISGSAWQ